ncbi:hypothetical protein ACWV26_09475 [Rummeliibacillus sp. JY-2-4R]
MKTNNQQEEHKDDSLQEEGKTIGEPLSEIKSNPPQKQSKVTRTFGIVVLGILLIVLGYTVIVNLM